jgi:ketosteroid isomerase-like protein
VPNVGKEAIHAAYDGVFQTIKLDIEFTVDEIIQVAPDWAFARTRSEGFVTINATGDKGPEANQELFVFQKQDDDTWKIARYIFSTTNPPRQ